MKRDFILADAPGCCCNSDKKQQKEIGVKPADCCPCLVTNHTLQSIISCHQVLWRGALNWHRETSLAGEGAQWASLRIDGPWKRCLPACYIPLCIISGLSLPSVFSGPCHFNGQLSIVAKHHISPVRGKRSQCCTSPLPDWRAVFWSTASREFTVKTLVHHNRHWMQNFPVSDYSEGKKALC